LSYGEETVKKLIDFTVDAKQSEQNDLSNNAHARQRNQGFFDDVGDYLTHFFGTCSNDVFKELTRNEKDIQQLREVAKTGDLLEFHKKYKQITGVDFDVYNIKNVMLAQNEYSAKLYVKDLREAKYGRVVGDMIYKVPFDECLRVFFHGNEKNVDTWKKEKIKQLGLEGKSETDKYMALLKEFEKASDNTIKKIEKEFGKIDEDSLEASKQELLNAQKAAYGRNTAADKIEKHIRNLSIANGAIDLGLFIGTAYLGGVAGGTIKASRLGTAAKTVEGIASVQKAAEAGSLIAAGLGGAAKTLINKRTDGIESSWGEDLKAAGIDGLVGAATYGLFSKTSKAISAAFTKRTMENATEVALKMNLNKELAEVLAKKVAKEKAANLLIRIPSEAAGGMVAGSTEAVLHGVIEGKSLGEITENIKNNAVGGALMGALMPIGSKVLGATFKSIKGLFTDKSAKFSDMLKFGISEKDIIRIEQRIKEQNHFDKLYEDAKQKSESAQQALSERLAQKKAKEGKLVEVKPIEDEPVETKSTQTTESFDSTDEAYWESNPDMEIWRKSYYERIGAFELTDEAVEYSQLTSKKTKTAQTSQTAQTSPSDTVSGNTEFDYEVLRSLNIDNFALSPDGRGVRGRCLLNRDPKYLQKLKEAGIEQIIDLRKEGNSAASKTLCANNGLQYLNFPVEYNIPMTAENINNLPLFIKAMQSGKYYIGCNMGTHRTDVALGISYIFNPDATVVPTFRSLNKIKAIEMLKKSCNEILGRNKVTKEFSVTDEYLRKMGWESKERFFEEFKKRFQLISVNNCKK
ncbi:hypothetical protein IJS77_04125, partial [bacterium]|nr:hypothetical protein [bacterium]